MNYPLLYMDEHTSKRAVGGLAVARKGSGSAFRDVSNNENQRFQCYNQSSTRLNSMKGTQIGSSDRAKYSGSFQSARRKTIFGSSSKMYSTVDTEVSEVIPSTLRIQTGLPKPEDAESGVLQRFSALEEVASYNIASNTKSQKQIHQRSGSGSSDTSLGSSVRRSFASRNNSQVANPAYLGQGANSSRHGLRNLRCTSISDVLPSGCSSSDSSHVRSKERRCGNSENLHSRPIPHPEDGIHLPFQGLSRHQDGFQRYNMDGIAEVFLALERIEQDEELTYEHRDMRLDIDNLSYEVSFFSDNAL
ncbi:hypothetical protein HHK36_013562 [Tetracentron sinense]|uniref:Uncharacterized protein n=1 Tax=Tetracentron sinense TaxID=13715 RepID=A0A834Z4B9_TETSI|nr:hypothetical protein HHK36_013562 [Tetracentron sinense]